MVVFSTILEEFTFCLILWFRITNAAIRFASDLICYCNNKCKKIAVLFVIDISNVHLLNNNYIIHSQMSVCVRKCYDLKVIGYISCMPEQLLFLYVFLNKSHVIAGEYLFGVHFHLHLHALVCKFLFGNFCCTCRSVHMLL